MNLSGKQGKFIEFYLANNFDAVGAAKAAGYKFRNIEVNARKLLDNPKIFRTIKNEIEKKASLHLPDKSFVLASLIKTVNICLATYIDKNGFECYKSPALIDKGLKSIEKIGRSLGMFEQSGKEKVDLPEINLISGIDNEEI